MVGFGKAIGYATRDIPAGPEAGRAAIPTMAPRTLRSLVRHKGRVGGHDCMAP